MAIINLNYCVRKIIEKNGGDFKVADFELIDKKIGIETEYIFKNKQTFLRYKVITSMSDVLEIVVIDEAKCKYDDFKYVYECDNFIVYSKNEIKPVSFKLCLGGGRKSEESTFIPNVKIAIAQNVLDFEDDVCVDADFFMKNIGNTTNSIRINTIVYIKKRTVYHTTNGSLVGSEMLILKINNDQFIELGDYPTEIISNRFKIGDKLIANQTEIISTILDLGVDYLFVTEKMV